jgi:copper homeostasis protein
LPTLCGVVLLEVCIDSSAGLRAAVDGKAGRLEVCSRLDLDGLTPTDDLLVEAVRSGIPCVAMIRRSAGNHFIGGRTNTPGMLHDLVRAKKLGAQGFALGALMLNGRVADGHVRSFVELAAPWPVTFHRAFDWTRDRFEALDALAELGVKRVLSSGGATNAFEGRNGLRELVEHARGRITIVAAGGVRAWNAREIVAVSGVSEVHSSTVFSVADLR